jgi:hypothetical protein
MCVAQDTQGLCVINIMLDFNNTCRSQKESLRKQFISACTTCGNVLLFFSMVLSVFSGVPLYPREMMRRVGMCQMRHPTLARVARLCFDNACTVCMQKDKSRGCMFNGFTGFTGFTLRLTGETN